MEGKAVSEEENKGNSRVIEGLRGRDEKGEKISIF